MKFKKIFIAGANGMLGTTLQNISKSDEYLLTDIETSENIKFCDIRNIEETAKIVREYKPDIIFNFAALVDLVMTQIQTSDRWMS